MNGLTCAFHRKSVGRLVLGVILAATASTVIGCSPSGLRAVAADAATGVGGTIGSGGSTRPLVGSGGAGTPDAGLVISLPSLPVCVCGDGVRCQNATLGQYEGCDDGNTKNDDGCSSTCYVEFGWSCPNPGHPCQSSRSEYQCGNGLLSQNERCDDGNTASGDGCSGDCQTIEPGWSCRVPGRPCTPLCGDGVLIGGEACDDGNTLSGDGCSRICQVEPGHGAGPTCGDGVVTPDEECDDGIDPTKNPHNDDGTYGGCTTACRYGGYCGDGIVNGPEACDDGSANGGIYGSASGCSFLCTPSRFCGDGIVDADYGEDCDLGASNEAQNSECTAHCHYILP